MCSNIWPPSVPRHVATYVVTPAADTKIAGYLHNNCFIVSIKKVASCLLTAFIPKFKAEPEASGTVTLLRISHARQSTRHLFVAQELNSDPPAALPELAHLQRHPDDKLISRTLNAIVRSTTTTVRGMTLSTAILPASQSADCKPLSGEAAPAPPQTAPGLAQGHSRLIAKAAADEVRMLLSVPHAGKIGCSADTSPLKIPGLPGTLQRHVTHLFKKSSQPDQSRQLLQRLHAALLPGKLTQQMLLLQHLAHVSAGDAGRALAALKALQKMHFLPLAWPAYNLSAREQQRLLRPSSSQAQLDALSIAAQLASTTLQFETLLSVMTLPLNEQQCDSVKRLLEASAYLEREQGRQVDLLHYTMPAWQHETGTATLAQTVLQIEVAALQRSGDIYAALSAADKAALFSWRNGYRSAAAGSDLAQTQARLCKMLTYIARANHMQDLRRISFDRNKPFSSSAHVINARMRIAAARLNQAIGRKKSPLATLSSLGINNAALGHPENDLALYYQSCVTALGLLHAWLNGVLANTPEQIWREELLKQHAQLPTTVEHAAILAHWSRLLAMRTTLDHRLDQDDVHAIAAQIAAHYQVEPAQSTIAIKLSHWIGHTLKVSELRHWAQLHGALLRHPEQAQETELGQALRLAHNISTSSCLPEDLSTDSLHQFMRTYLQEHNVGNPVTLANGSVIGISTAPVSLSLATISQALTLISPATLAPRIDAHVSRTHNGVVNFGSTTHGFEIFIGTQTQTSTALSASVDIRTHPFFSYVGWQTGAGATASAGADHIKTRGVMVRALRLEKTDGSAMDTAQARAEIIAFNDLMFAIAKGQHGVIQGDAVWQKIAEQFFTSKSLSIGWHDQRKLTPHLTGTAGGYSRGSAGIGISHGASAGFSLAHTLDWTPLGIYTRLEDSGANRMLRSNFFSRVHHINTVGAANASSAIPVHTSGTDTESLSLPQLSQAQNYLVRDDGFSVTFRTILTQDRLSEPYTLRDLEQRDAKVFIHALQEPACYAQYLQVFKGRYGAQYGRQKLDEFITKIKNWAGPGQRYVMRSRIRTEVREKLNACIALTNIIGKQDAHSPALQELSKHMQQLLRDDASWVPIEIMAIESQTARDAMGLSFGLQLAAQDSVVSDRELSFVGLPLPLANHWTRRHADGGQRYAMARAQLK